MSTAQDPALGPTAPATLLDENEAARILRIKTQTLRVWRCSGRYDLPFVKVGRAVRYRLADINEFIARQSCTATGCSSLARR